MTNNILLRIDREGKIEPARRREREGERERMGKQEMEKGTPSLAQPYLELSSITHLMANRVNCLRTIQLLNLFLHPSEVRVTTVGSNYLELRVEK